jgi:hypothetical protein
MPHPYLIFSSAPWRNWPARWCPPNITSSSIRRRRGRVLRRGTRRISGAG